MSDEIKDIETKKAETPYKVSTIHCSTKDVDLKKRIVIGMFNTSYFVDSDQDMLIDGAASESIAKNGAGSTNGNKIKHLKDHSWKQAVARLNVLDYRSIELNGKTASGIYHESYYRQP